MFWPLLKRPYQQQGYFYHIHIIFFWPSTLFFILIIVYLIVNYFHSRFESTMSIGAPVSPLKDQHSTSFFGRLLHSTPTSIRTSARSTLRSLASFQEESETPLESISQKSTSSSHDALVQLLRSFASTVNQAADVFDSIDSSLRLTHARIDNLRNRSDAVAERIQHGDACRHCMPMPSYEC